MALINFGYKVDMNALENPLEGSFFVAYDLDGYLKQLDHLGNLTRIGSVTSVVGAESNFWLTDSGLDSLGNKTASIIRPGSIRIGPTNSSYYTEMTSNSLSIGTFFTINDYNLIIDGSTNYGGDTIYWDPYSGFNFYNSDYSYQTGLSSYQLSLYDSQGNTTNIYAYGFYTTGNSSYTSLDIFNGFYIEGPGTAMSYSQQISASFSRFTQQTTYTNTLTLLPTTLSGVQVQYYPNKSGTFSLIDDVIDSSLFYLVGSTSSVINSKTQSIYRTGNIGIGTASPSTKLHIFSTQSGAFRLQDGTQGNNYILTSDTNGVATWSPLSTIGISGSATYIPLFTGTSSLGNSHFIDNGSSGSYTVGDSSVTFLPGANVALRLSRAQSSMDFTLGNPGIGQPGVITSQNTLGLDLKSQGYLSFSSGPSYSEAMRISTNGYLGIGLTATPSTKLHIYATQSGFGFRLQDSSQGNNYILTSNSIGMGSWTSSITVDNISIKDVPTYSDNSTAISGGLTNSNVYRTSTGVLMIVY